MKHHHEQYNHSTNAIISDVFSLTFDELNTEIPSLRAGMLIMLVSQSDTHAHPTDDADSRIRVRATAEVVVAESQITSCRLHMCTTERAGFVGH